MFFLIYFFQLVLVGVVLASYIFGKKQSVHGFLFSISFYFYLQIFITYLLLLVAPNQDKLLYLFGPAFLMLFPLLVPKIRKRYILSLNELLFNFRDIQKNLSCSVQDIFYILIVFILFISYIKSSLAAPLTTSDPIEYAYLSNLIVNQKSIQFFPLMGEKNLSGFNIGGLHPPSFGVFQAILLFLGDSPSATLGFVRLYPPLVFLIILFCFICIFHQRPLRFIIVGFLTFFLAPRVILNGSQFHVDLFRIAAFILPFACIRIIKMNRNLGVFLFGVTSGFASFSHSLGLIGAFINFCFCAFYFRKRIPFYLIGFLSVAFIPYIKNYLNTGLIVGDMNGLWEVFSPQIERYFSITREIKDRYGLLKMGIGSFFWRFEVFGRLGIVGAFCILPFLKNFKRKSVLQKAIGYYLLAFFTIFIFELILFKPIISKNFRYLLTVLPVFSFVLIEVLWKYEKKINGILLFAVMFFTIGSDIKGLMPPGVTLGILPNFSKKIGGIVSDFSKPEVEHLSKNSDLLIFDSFEKRYKPKNNVVSYAYPESKFYSTLRQYRSTDPFLRPMYERKSNEEVLHFLKENKIDFIIVPNWLNPMLTVGEIGNFLNDRSYSRIILYNNSFKIYEVFELGARKTSSDVFKPVVNQKVILKLPSECQIINNKFERIANCYITIKFSGLNKMVIKTQNSKWKKNFTLFEEIFIGSQEHVRQVPISFQTKDDLILEFELGINNQEFNLESTDLIVEKM